MKKVLVQRQLREGEGSRRKQLKAIKVGGLKKVLDEREMLGGGSKGNSMKP